MGPICEVRDQIACSIIDNKNINVVRVQIYQKLHHRLEQLARTQR